MGSLIKQQTSKNRRSCPPLTKNKNGENPSLHFHGRRHRRLASTPGASSVLHRPAHLSFIFANWLQPCYQRPFFRDLSGNRGVSCPFLCESMLAGTAPTNLRHLDSVFLGLVLPFVLGKGDSRLSDSSFLRTRLHCLPPPKSNGNPPSVVLPLTLSYLCS